MGHRIGLSNSGVWLSLLAGAALLAALVPSPAAAAPGELDPSFGTGGSVRLLASSEEAYAEGIATQPDGKVVVAGARRPGNVVLIRLLRDGSPDPGFGAGGEVVTPFPSGYANARAVAIQPDGKIVVAGGATGAANEDFFVARYTPTGALDPSFGGGDGIAIVPVGAEDDEAHDVTIAADGSIVAVGISDLPESNRAVGVLVLRPDGSPDPGFAADGSTVLSTPDGEGDDRGEAVAVSAGRILIADSNAAGGGHGFTLIRLLPDGSLDPSFGSGGIAVTSIPVPGYPEIESGRVTDIALLADGRIVASGYGTDYGGSPPKYDGKVAAVRYLPDGEPDPSFGENGIFTLQLGPGNESARAVEVDPDGRYLLAGSYLVREEPVSIDAPLAMRLDPNGTLDPSYGTGGVVLRGQTAPFGEYVDNAALGGDGSLLTIGAAYGGNNTSWTSVTRYLGDPVPPRVPVPMPPPESSPPAPKPSPHARMKKVPRKLARTKLSGFSGTASGGGGTLAKVQIALVAVRPGGAKLARAGGRSCSVLANARGRFKVVKAKKGRPCPLRWLTAGGKARWRFKLKAVLPTGRYVVYSRAVDADGRAESAFSRKAGNRYAFRLLAARSAARGTAAR